MELGKPFHVDSSSSDANLAAISIQCLHCRKFGSFDVMDQTVLLQSQQQFKEMQMQADRLAMNVYRSGKKVPNGIEYIISIRICPNINCRGLVFMITDGVGALYTCYRMKLADPRGSSGAASDAALLWSTFDTVAARSVATRPSPSRRRREQRPQGRKDIRS